MSAFYNIFATKTSFPDVWYFLPLSLFRKTLSMLIKKNCFVINYKNIFIADRRGHLEITNRVEDTNRAKDIFHSISRATCRRPVVTLYNFPLCCASAYDKKPQRSREYEAGSSSSNLGGNHHSYAPSPHSVPPVQQLPYTAPAPRHDQPPIEWVSSSHCLLFCISKRRVCSHMSISFLWGLFSWNICQNYFVLCYVILVPVENFYSL